MHRKVGSSQASHKIVGIDRWRPWLPILALGLVWAAKLLIVRQLHEHPLLQPESGLDTSAYVDLANAVRHGNPGLGPGLYYLSPFYIYFLAVSLTLLQSFTAVRVLQVTLGTASVAFVFLMTQAWFGRRAAWYAGALAAVTGLLTFYETILLQAAVDPFLTSAALLALTFALTRDDRRWLLAAGVLFGLATLNRPNMALAALGIGTVLLAQRRVLPAFVLVAGLLLGVSPVAIRNVVVAHQWSLVSSHGGLNFYIGNGEGATGFFRPLPGITPNITGQAEDARRVAEEALGHPLTDAETSDYFFARAWDWTAAHPAAAGWLLIEKLGFVFSAQHIALPHSYPFYAYDSLTAPALSRSGPLAAAAAGAGRAGVRGAARSPPRLPGLGLVRAGLCRRRRGLLRRRALSSAALDPDVRRRGRGDRRRVDAMGGAPRIAPDCPGAGRRPAGCGRQLAARSPGWPLGGRAADGGADDRRRPPGRRRRLGGTERGA